MECDLSSPYLKDNLTEMSVREWVQPLYFILKQPMIYVPFVVEKPFQCFKKKFTVSLFCLIWGRNKTLFPMPKSIFFPQLLTKNSKLEIVKN